MKEIYLMRHAHSQANITHVFGLDLPLSDKGIKQAGKAREKYNRSDYDMICSSCLKRAVQTAEIVFGAPPEKQFKEFNEIWFGEAEGKLSTRTGIEGYVNQYKDDTAAFMKECKGDDLYERAEKAMEKMCEIFSEMKDGSRMLIVTSDSLIRSIILTFERGHDWTHIKDVPHIDNLQTIKVTYTDRIEKIEIEENR